MNFKPFFGGHRQSRKGDNTGAEKIEADGNNPSPSSQHRLGREMMIFARRLRKTARRTSRDVTLNGKHQFVRFQKNFSALVKRVGEANAFHSIQSKIKSSNQRAGNLAGQFRI